MKRDNGFILIVALVVMAVLLLLGIGASFLGSTNVQVARNVSLQAAVRAQAEAGVDLTLARLNQVDPANATQILYKNWPCWYNSTTKTSVPAPTGVTFTVTITALNPSVTPPTCTSGVATNSDVPIVVKSVSTIGDSTWSSEAVVMNATNTTKNKPEFDRGIVTNSNLKCPGTCNFRIDLQAGGDITATGQSTLGDYRALYDASSNKKCTFGGEVNSNVCIPSPPPTVPAPVFESQRSDLIKAMGMTYTNATTAPACPTLMPANTGITSCTALATGTTTVTQSYSNAIIVLPKGANVTFSGTLDNVIVIADSTATVTFNGTNPSTTKAALNNVQVASGTINFSADVSNVPQTVGSTGGTSTTIAGSAFYAKSGYTFGKNVFGNDTKASQTLLSSEGSITLNGNGGASIYATLWSGGAIDINGTTSNWLFRGTIAATGTITANGGVDYMGRPEGGVRIPSVPRVPTPGNIAILSRK